MTAPTQKRLNPVTPAYLALVQALDQRRQDLALSHEELCYRAGIGQRQWAKYVNPETVAGRVACWTTLQKIVAVVYPAGFLIFPKQSADL